MSRSANLMMLRRQLDNESVASCHSTRLLFFTPESFEVERQLSMMFHCEEDHLVSAYEIQHEILVHHALTQVVLFTEKRAQPFAQHSCLYRLDRAG